jgi:hypothetical protein
MRWIYSRWQWWWGSRWRWDTSCGICFLWLSRKSRNHGILIFVFSHSFPRLVTHRNGNEVRDSRFITSETALHVGTYTRDGLFSRLSNKLLTTYDSVLQSYCDSGKSTFVVTYISINHRCQIRWPILLLRTRYPSSSRFTIPNMIVRLCPLFLTRLVVIVDRWKSLRWKTWVRFETGSCLFLSLLAPPWLISQLLSQNGSIQHLFFRGWTPLL